MSIENKEKVEYEAEKLSLPVESNVIQREKEKEMFLPQNESNICFKKPLERSVSRREQAKEDRRYFLGILLFLLLNVLLIVLIAITAYYIHSEKNEVVLRDSDICVPCEDLRLHPDDPKLEGIERRGDNKETCCAKDKEGSDKLIGYFTDHWLKIKLAKDDRNFTRYECGEDSAHKPIIKLVGKASKQLGPIHQKVKWDGESDIAIYSKDDKIKHHEEHGVIEIRKSGLYQIYSQVVLEHEIAGQNQHGSASIYQHSVVLKQAGMPDDNYQEKSILRVSNTHCASQSDTHTITSYISGAFQLTEGDKLGVRVHNRSEITAVPHMNFFGAHML